MIARRLACATLILLFATSCQRIIIAEYPVKQPNDADILECQAGFDVARYAAADTAPVDTASGELPRYWSAYVFLDPHNIAMYWDKNSLSQIFVSAEVRIPTTGEPIISDFPLFTAHKGSIQQHSGIDVLHKLPIMPNAREQVSITLKVRYLKNREALDTARKILEVAEGIAKPFLDNYPVASQVLSAATGAIDQAVKEDKDQPPNSLTKYIVPDFLTNARLRDGRWHSTTAFLLLTKKDIEAEDKAKDEVAEKAREEGLQAARQDLVTKKRAFDAAKLTVEEARSTVGNAQKDHDSAQADLDEATAAVATATAAVTAANTAKTDAENAREKANTKSAKKAAQTKVDQAGAALQTAEAALQTDQVALQTAEGVSTTAENELTTAKNELTTAKNELTTAASHLETLQIAAAKAQPITPQGLSAGRYARGLTTCTDMPFALCELEHQYAPVIGSQCYQERPVTLPYITVTLRGYDEVYDPLLLLDGGYSRCAMLGEASIDRVHKYLDANRPLFHPDDIAQVESNIVAAERQLQARKLAAGGDPLAMIEFLNQHGRPDWAPFVREDNCRSSYETDNDQPPCSPLVDDAWHLWECEQELWRPEPGRSARDLWLLAYEEDEGEGASGSRDEQQKRCGKLAPSACEVSRLGRSLNQVFTSLGIPLELAKAHDNQAYDLLKQGKLASAPMLDSWYRRLRAAQHELRLQIDTFSAEGLCLTPDDYADYVTPYCDECRKSLDKLAADGGCGPAWAKSAQEHLRSFLTAQPLPPRGSAL